ncbi:phage scaffolding protein, partial [bacterium]|nr:phage scaffolding protein [bacterium]
ALTKAGSKNNKAVKALLSEFLEKAELDDKGKLKGLDKEIKALQTSDDYLFGGTTATPKVTKSYVPETSSSDIIETHFTKDNFDLTKLGKIYKENPSQAKSLADNVGLNLF